MSESNDTNRYASSIRRLRRQGRTRSSDHFIDWCVKPVTANSLHQYDLMLPNVIKVVYDGLKKHTTGLKDTECKTYVLNVKYTHEAFITRPVDDKEQGPIRGRFLLPTDYNGRFHVIHDTKCLYAITDLVRILPKCVKLRSILQNITTKAKRFNFPIGSIINIEGLTYSATMTGVQTFLRCSFRGNTFFTLNLDCIGNFEILPDTASYSLREIEARFPTPVRVRISENSANHKELLMQSNIGEFILETTKKEEYLVGNCKADNSIILFSSRSDAKFQVTNAVLNGERDNRFIVKHYGNEYFPVKFNFAKVIGLSGDSFFETNIEPDDQRVSLLNLI